MSKRSMAQVVSQADRFRQIFIQIQSTGDRAGNL